jgi:glutamine synthetase
MESAVFGSEIQKLPGEIDTAIANFENSDFMKKILGEENHRKYAGLKRTVSERSPKALGTKIKNGEILFHHEVYNQMIWSAF